MRYRQTQKIQLNKNKIFKIIFERAQRKTPIFQIHVWAVEALLIFLICNLAAKVLPFFPYLTSKTTKFLFFPTWKPFSSTILLLLRWRSQGIYFVYKITKEYTIAVKRVGFFSKISSVMRCLLITWLFLMNQWQSILKVTDKLR